MNSPNAIFKKNVKRQAEIVTGLKKKYVFWSGIRVTVFLLFIICVIYFANARNTEVVVGLGLIFPVLFGLLIKYHNKIAFNRDHAENLKAINQQETLRLQGNLKSFDAGSEYIDPLHPYSIDLDIFGSHSLFQLLNRTTTFGAKTQLSEWLLNPAEKQIIEARQVAVKELTPKIDWRQDFQAHGMHFIQEENKTSALLKWLNQEDVVKNKSLYRLLMCIMPAVSVGCIVLWILGFSFYFLLGAVVANSIILKNVLLAAKDTTTYTRKSSVALKAYSYLIKKVENETFSAPLLLELKNQFDHDHFKASAEIKKLQQILFSLESRANLFYQILNALLLLDVFWLLKASAWKQKNKKYAKKWFDTIHQFEVLNSLAGFSYANPGYTMPVIIDETYRLNGMAMGHPLIRSKDRVVNDFSMTGKGKVIIITGSNMSGKSTFLRTAGINVVLALMGAPVCAGSFTTSVLQVFTSMRTQDNLEESVSSFYAELKRLKQLLEMIGTTHPILFMLDEILKGTNSHDRHNGAASLIRQLAETDSFGFVSTHDLALGALSDDANRIENYSFNSQIIDDEIIFDYKLHPGLCKSFNASKLMEKMGIKIE
ncbi:MAG: DNA mismatch repair protein MutS [Cytophagales bacterium]|nr:DNA mismatch repair protein MutS [Cytophagales bacterium]